MGNTTEVDKGNRGPGSWPLTGSARAAIAGNGGNGSGHSPFDARTVLVTPDLARDWLATAASNRKLNQRHVVILAEDMRHGRWALTHQGLAFDEHGRLVDGQHRLHAVILAGCSVLMMVVRGVALESVLNAVDQGTIRTPGQALIMRGVANGTLVAAISRNVGVLTSADLQYTARLGGAGVEEIRTLYAESIAFVVDRYNRICKSPYCAPIVVAHAHESTRAKAIEFHEAVVSGEGLLAGDPRLALRNHLIGIVGAAGGGTVGAIMARTIGAFDTFMRGERSTKSVVSVERYRRFATQLALPINTSLMAVCE